MRRLFQKYGKIVDITIPLDYYSRSTKGYAFIQYPFLMLNNFFYLLFVCVSLTIYLFTYEDQRDAEEALYKLDKQPLFGRELEVEYARGERKSKLFL